MPSQTRPPLHSPLRVTSRSVHLHSSPLRPSASRRPPPSPPLRVASIASHRSPRALLGGQPKRRLETADATHPTGRHAPSSETSKRPRLSPANAAQEAATFPLLRSGRTFSHPLVVEVATMEMSGLSDFELDPLPSTGTAGSRAGDMSASETTETKPALSPRESTSTVLTPRGSPLASSSQSTIDPYEYDRLYHSTGSPNDLSSQSSVESAEFVTVYNVPDWYAEAFESDGYDSEALVQIAPYARRIPRAPASSVASSPGFTVVRDTAHRSASDEWLPEPWPADIKPLSAQFNPANWKFNPVPIGMRGGHGCGCVCRCNALTCLNARNNRFCTEQNCAFAGGCGNSLKEHSALVVARNSRTGIRGLVATAAIPAGEVLGQYLGHLQLFGSPGRNSPPNRGYRMRLATRTTTNKYVGIDAVEAGGMTRLLNHSCKPAARFHEVQTGRSLTVVAVTVRDVFPGEEVTVSYGNKLWFVCRCGWWGCQHRHLQHLPDVLSATSA